MVSGINVPPLRLWSMGRGLDTNAQVTIPGGLGFEHGPLGGGFSPGVGRGYEVDMARSHWPEKLGGPFVLKNIIKKHNFFYIVWAGHAPNPRPTIPSSMWVSSGKPTQAMCQPMP
ncbi:hypothetical protein Hanom_Chr12g01075961 [Helianthus anomalus]